MPAPPAMCPILTSVQAVPRAFEVRASSFKLGVGPSKTAVADEKGQIRQVAGYAAVGELTLEGGLSYKVKPENRNMADPPIQPDTFRVPCQGAACKFWGEDVKDCRLVAYGPVLAQAVAALTAAQVK